MKICLIYHQYYTFLFQFVIQQFINSNIINLKMSLGQRYGKLSEKLVSAKNQSRLPKVQTLETKVKIIQQKFMESITAYNHKILLLKQDVIKLTKNIEEDNRTYAFQNEARLKEIQALDYKINKKLQYEIIQRKEGQNRILSVLQQKVATLKNQINNQVQNRSQVIQSITHTLQNDLPSLMEIIKTESIQRQQYDNQILEHANTQIRNVNQIIIGQKKLREESENSMLELIKQLVNKVKKQIDQQRKARQVNHDSILGLVEDACNKISYQN